MLCWISFTIPPARVGVEGVFLKDLKAPYCACSPGYNSIWFLNDYQCGSLHPQFVCSLGGKEGSGTEDEAKMTFPWLCTHVRYFFTKSIYLLCLWAFQKEGFSSAFFLIKERKTLHLLFFFSHSIVCIAVRAGDTGNSPYFTPQVCPRAQPTMHRVEKEMPPSLKSFSSFSFWFCLPCLLVVLGDGIKLERKKLRPSVVTSLSSVFQEHVTRSHERQNSSFWSGWRPGGSYGFSLVGPVSGPPSYP